MLKTIRCHCFCFSAAALVSHWNLMHKRRHCIYRIMSNNLPKRSHTEGALRPKKYKDVHLTVVHDGVRLEVLRGHLIHAAAAIRGISGYEN